MCRYTCRRLFQALVILWGIISVVFVMMRLGGDPALILPPDDAPRAMVERFRRDLGLDQPLPVRYARFIVKAAQGDFGDSLRQRQPALPRVVERFPATAQLALSALLVGVGAGIPTGLVAAFRCGSVVEAIAKMLALAGQSVPAFWLGIMLILLLAVRWGLLPTSDREGPETLVMPAVTLGAQQIGIMIRLTRSSMLDVLGQDYIRTPVAKGVAGWVVIYRHALKNAFIPVLTVIGLELTTLLSGAVIVETIFAWPGVGRLAIQSISYREYPVVLSVVFVAGTIYVIGNLLVDLACGWLDPRIRFG